MISRNSVRKRIREAKNLFRKKLSEIVLDKIRDEIIIRRMLEGAPKTPEAKYRQQLRSLQKEYTNISNGGVKRARELVSAAQTRIGDLISAAGPFEAAILPELRTRIEDTLRELETNMQAEVSVRQNQAFNNGANITDESLAARGFPVGLPQMPTATMTVASNFAADKITGLAAETMSAISNELSLGVMTGRSVSDVSRSIRDVLSGTPPRVEGAGRRYSTRYQAETIARTEISRMHDLANRTRLSQAAEEVPGLKVEWIAEPDHCEQCDPFAGNIYDIDKAPEIPVHPNCHCVLIPYKEEWGAPLAKPEEELGPIRSVDSQFNRMGDKNAIDWMVEQSKLSGDTMTTDSAQTMLDAMKKWTDKDYDKIREFQKTPTAQAMRRWKKTYPELKAYADALERYTRIAPSYEGTIYRGLKPVAGFKPAEVYKDLKAGDVIDMKGLSSWSSYEKSVKDKFVGEGGVIFRTSQTVRNGAPASHLARYGSEQEVIVSGETKFRVVSAPEKWKYADIWNIELEPIQ